MAKPVTAVGEPPSADGGITRLAVAKTLAAGIDPAPLLRQAGFDPTVVDDPKARLSVRSQVEFLNGAAAALNDPLLGFHLALDLEPRRIGLLYFVMASSATLGEALVRAERYSTLTNEGIVLRCDHAFDHAVRYTYVGVPRHLDRHQIEFWAMALVRIARQLTVPSLRPVCASLAHHRNDVSDALDAFLGCPIAFGAEHDQIVFSSSACAVPQTSADPYLNDLLVGYCEEALAHRIRPAAALRTRVENAITPLLPHGRARVGEVARELGIGQRTLSRRLAAENLTFSGVLDELRADLARHHLKDTSLAISQIAWLLGFQEVSAFTHAFKRWTGRTPTDARTPRFDATP
jgi:AraC-like DNA-binding protein